MTSTTWTKTNDQSTSWSKSVAVATEYTKGSNTSSNWAPPNILGGFLLLQDGSSKLLLQNGVDYLRRQ